MALLNNGADNTDPITLQVSFNDADRGLPLRETLVTLAPGQGTQLLNPLAERGAQNGWATIYRRAVSSPWVAYAVINDGGVPGQRTGDGALFLATVP